MNESNQQNTNNVPVSVLGTSPNRKKLFWIIGAAVAVIILAALGFFWWQTQQQETGQEEEQGGSFRVISAAGNEDYRDVYFITAEGERRLIAESSRHTSPVDPDTGYQDVHRTMRYLDSEVQVSPNKRGVLLRASCWETPCPQVYDTESGQIHFVEPGYSNELVWLGDNRLHFEGWCDYSGIQCYDDVYESTNASRPWEMEQIGGTATEIEGWQTYRNEEYGFEVKYPNWYDGIVGCQPFVSTDDKRVDIGPAQFRVNDLRRRSFDTFVDNETQPPSSEAPQNIQDSYQLHSKEDIEFYGYKAVKTVESFCGASCYSPTSVYIDREDGTAFEIGYDDGIINQCSIVFAEQGEAMEELPSETVTQILSTFRFTN